MVFCGAAKSRQQIQTNIRFCHQLQTFFLSSAQRSARCCGRGKGRLKTSPRSAIFGFEILRIGDVVTHAAPFLRKGRRIAYAYSARPGFLRNASWVCRLVVYLGDCWSVFSAPSRTRALAGRNVERQEGSGGGH